MGYHDIQQVCLNGHQITDSFSKFPEHRKDFCDECGAKTIYKCLDCDTPIKGHYYVDGVVCAIGTSVPEYCHNCGSPYPWTQNKLEIDNDYFFDLNDSNSILRHLFTKFHSIVKQLRYRHDNRTTLDIGDEYDVQDLLHALLRLFFEDIRPEEWTPSYAGKSSRMDFLLKDVMTVIEVKKTRKGLGAKELGDELIVDITRYKEHPSCKILFCFVYDPEERIVNPKGVENDLSREADGLLVEVFIVPKH